MAVKERQFQARASSGRVWPRDTAASVSEAAVFPHVSLLAQMSTVKHATRSYAFYEVI